MEFYAKSKNKVLSLKEREAICNRIQNLMLDLEESLEEWEKIALEKEIAKIMHKDSVSQQTLSEHLNETENCAKLFFDQYGQYFTEKEKVLVIEACRLHDLGKVNLAFQIMVNPKLRDTLPMGSQPKYQIPHGYLSAVSISKEGFLKNHPMLDKKDFNILITAIYYHHTRKDDFNNTEIRKYCSKYYEKYIREYLGNSAWRLRLSNSNNLLFWNRLENENKKLDDKEWNRYLLVKGLLNKFDWCVSAGYRVSEMEADIQKRMLAKAITKKLKNDFRPAQIYMQEHKDENVVIVAPTGSGKTEAALLWINGEKGFYTLPLKVSSNAIYQRIKETYCYEQVSLLHSDSMPSYLKEEKETEEAEADGYGKYERAKLLSFPLTICTVDQLFKFVYKALGTEIFAATLKYSKIVIDEIQAYSPRIMATLIYGLKTIQAMGGKFAIITATFPPVLFHFMEEHGLVCGKNYVFRNFSADSPLVRHKFQIREGDLDTDEIIEYSKSKKILVICNTVNRAQEVYTKISEETEDVYLLHSRFIRKDRDVLESMIMDFSRYPEECGIWITTQIVEASLDIDFDMLYTEMCPGDNLLQRMGRCNRASRYTPSEPNIHIFANKNGVGKNNVYEEEIYNRSLAYLREYEGRLFTEDLKSQYVDKIYCTKEIINTSYYKEIEKYLKHFETVRPMDYTKEEADDEFRKIRSITVIPDVIYQSKMDMFEKSISFINRPRIGVKVKSILRAKLNSQTLSMNIYNRKYPEGVDAASIGTTNIHRTELKYDFDNERRKGMGLILNKKEDENFIL